MKPILPLAAASCLVQAIPLHAAQEIRDTFYSDIMGIEVAYAIVLPDSYDSEPDRIFPVLYGLHGTGSPYDTWANMPPLKREIDGDYPAVIATFEGKRSFYLDHPTDQSSQYTSFFFEEFVPFVETTYRAGRKASLRGITGFSMGGYGAIHLTLEKPDFFSSTSTLSGAFDRNPFGQTDLVPINRIPVAAAAGTVLPPIYINCGTADALITDNRQFESLLTTEGYPHVYIETQGAGHNWPFWRDTSEDVIHWHYQYFEDTWRGFPVTGDGWADTGEPLGEVYFAHDPWIWVSKTQGWAFILENWSMQSPNGWIWFKKNE